MKVHKKFPRKNDNIPFTIASDVMEDKYEAVYGRTGFTTKGGRGRENRTIERRRRWKLIGSQMRGTTYQDVRVNI